LSRLQAFLDKYDTILLDMDGVITSEEIYWDTAALTVWEMLGSDRYFGTESFNPAMADSVSAIRKQVFAGDDLIKTVKARGVNNNWDLAWLVIGMALCENTRDFALVFEKIKALPETANEMFAALSARLVKDCGMTEAEGAHWGLFWKQVQHCFQEWFLGSERFPLYWDSPMLQAGKTGLSFREEPLVKKEPLVLLLKTLGAQKRLGVGTGRPRIEAETPLISWGVFDAFTPDAFITYQEVIAAQNAAKEKGAEQTLTKPHPYMFLRGVFGQTLPDDILLSGQFDNGPCKKTLVIGDAACDLLSAKAAGCDFLAVLTGIDGESAREFFERSGADYVVSDILELFVS